LLFGQGAGERDGGSLAILEVFAEADFDDERLFRKELGQLHAQVERGGFENEDGKGRGIVEVGFELLDGGIAIFLAELFDFFHIMQENNWRGASMGRVCACSRASCVSPRSAE